MIRTCKQCLLRARRWIFRRGPALASSIDVDCWIGIVQEGDCRIIRLAGRLGEAEVPELLTACSGRGPVQLDLSDLVSTDCVGLEALHRVRARGAAFVGVPRHIQLWLDSPFRGQGQCVRAPNNRR